MLLTAAGDPPRTPIQQLWFTSSFPLDTIPARAGGSLPFELLPQPTPAATFPAPSASFVLGYVAVTAGVLQSTGGKREREPLQILAHELSISAKNPILPFVLIGPSTAQVGLWRMVAVKHKGRQKHQRHLGNYPDEYSKDCLKSTLST